MIKYTRPTDLIYTIACLITCQMLFGVGCSPDTHEEMPAPHHDAQDLDQDSMEDGAEMDDATRVAQLILSPDPVEAVAT